MTAARDSLGEVTKLPAAQQLLGELRTQLTQLIANFNELITTNTEWKASYAKVDANLTALIGAQTAEESTTAAAAATAPAVATAGVTGAAGATTSATGAVGTSGTATDTLDPAIKAKLAEFRAHLKEFEKAANGSGQN
jgi:peptidoglycan hydrolase CwlO-like protein